MAAKAGRVLVSHDRKTMPRHFARFIEQQDSASLIIVRQRLDIGVAIEQLLLLWVAMEAEEIRNVIYSLPLQG